MKKFISLFIVSIIVLGFIIGQCNSSSDSYMEDDEVISVDTECIEETSSHESDVTNVSDVANEFEVNEEEAKDIEIEKYTINDSICLVKIPSSFPHQMLIRAAYYTSYNNRTKCPNWVSWHLTRNHTDGSFSRKGVPYYDDNGSVIGIGHVTPETNKGVYFVDLEAKLPRQELYDWPHNRYNMSHGHMCPAGDNKWSKEAMNQSFLLTNMCPQSQESNGGDWRILEEKCRKWAEKYDDLYIVCGPIFLNKDYKTIGNTKIAVPDAFFKVIIRLSNRPEGIGFILPNDDTKKQLRDYCQTIDEIEEITGFDFFYSLPDKIEEEIENKALYSHW